MISEEEVKSVKEEKKEESSLEEDMTSTVVNRALSLKEKQSKGVDARVAIAFFGSLGFYVATPIVLGGFVGNWLDKKYPDSEVSWSLNMILFGVLLGVFTASQWLKKEAIDGTFKYQRKQKKQREELKKELEEKIEKKEVKSDDDV